MLQTRMVVSSLWQSKEKTTDNRLQTYSGCQRNNHSYHVVESVPDVPVIFKGFQLKNRKRKKKENVFILSLLDIIRLYKDVLYK